MHKIPLADSKIITEKKCHPSVQVGSNLNSGLWVSVRELSDEQIATCNSATEVDS
jgi:hypothetical protein